MTPDCNDREQGFIFVFSVTEQLNRVNLTHSSGSNPENIPASTALWVTQRQTQKT